MTEESIGGLAVEESSLDNVATRSAILVLDDDDGARETLTEVLRNEGYFPLGFARAADALRSIEEQIVPNLLLVDLVLKEGMGGVGFIRAYRERPNPRPIILISENPLGSENKALLKERYGVVGSLRKPFDLVGLQRAVAANL